jgi:hypothetical protein
LKKAEMLKYRIPEFPTIPSLTSIDNGAEYYPDVGKLSQIQTPTDLIDLIFLIEYHYFSVLVCNKTSPSEFTTVKYDLMCDMLNKMFQGSNLKIFGKLQLSLE